jgi:hypothetical protein
MMKAFFILAAVYTIKRRKNYTSLPNASHIGTLLNFINQFLTRFLPGATPQPVVHFVLLPNTPPMANALLRWYVGRYRC